MNKTLLVVLAICLVSVHAFVKRDAPAANTPSQLEDLKKDIEKVLNDIKDNMQKAFDPETVKKNFNDIVDKVSSGIKPAGEAPK